MKGDHRGSQAFSTPPAAKYAASPLARGTSVRIEIPETRAERAFHLGEAGALAHASYRKEPRFKFLQLRFLKGDNSGQGET